MAIQAIQNEKEEQFLQAYEQHSDAIFRYCYYRVFDLEKAKDFVQETYFRTWKYIVAGHEINNIRAFLYKTANHVIIDDARKKKSVSLNQLMEKGFAPSADLREASEQYFVGREILQMVKSIGKKYRDVIVMKYFEDFSAKEISLILHETKNNIYVRLSRGLKKLKEIF